ncbi:S8 family serine peptidase [Gottfriedia acidiceleris]|uniref:S8 family serine peptidase n=1 Tax=Gottfriedia acidiceleris TaxID=371036 RepID=A0ABY4JLP1_9BACI|nr:S8 family serine peptidase [Gottfriedia acidiceleris]UPM54114.1 S8 family serine peptidase [Gottfriedia acidiceleris]
MKVTTLAKHSAVLALSTSLLISPFSAKSYLTANAATSKAEEILASITPEQREALKQLELNGQEGLQGFQVGELDSDKNVSVIVQFNSDPSNVAVLEAAIDGKSLTKESAKEQVDKEHKVFKEDVGKFVKVKEKKNAPVITKTYKTAFNGAAITLPANQVKELLKSDAVKAIYKDVTFNVDPVKEDVPTDIASKTTTSVDSISYLNVDMLHKEGITGKGVKIGVLDTGIDYNHPDLKDAFKGGYDFVDNDNDPMEATYKDWQASKQPETNGNGSYYTEHGTHVSGTIVGQNKGENGVSVEGVAPDADLYMYRVLGPYGTGSTENILAGIDKAVQDGMDVINLSLGAAINNPYYPSSTAINYAVLNGVTAVVSAGNSGPKAYTLGSPGTAAFALTVGASDVPTSITTFDGKVAGGWSTDLVSMARSFADSFNSLEGKSLELVDVGLGTLNDYKNKNVAGKIAFVQRGNFALVDKVKFAKQNGAKAVIMYNNVDGHVGSNLGESMEYIPAFSMTKKAGEELKAKNANGNTTFTFTNLKEVTTEGDKLADFSSRGPVKGNFQMKPEITAPGVSVLSTVPSYIANHDTPEDYRYAYQRLDGTSMASPFAAGVAALLIGQNPNLQPADVKSILMNTADKLNGNYSVFEVGAGRVDPYQALHTQTEIKVQDETLIPVGNDLINAKNETGGLSFGKQVVKDDSELKVKKDIEFKNNSDKKKTFDVKVVDNANGKNGLQENGVVLDISNSIKVDKNTVKTVKATLTVPSTAKIGYYEGYVLLTNSEDKTEQYRIPFSFKKSDEGFDTLSLSSHAISPLYYGTYDSYKTFVTSLKFNLGSPVDNLDVVLQDANTNQDLGLVGTLNMKSATTDVDYFIQQAFYGAYYKFTGDKKQPVSTEVSQAKPGHYKLKFITTLPNGKQKIKSDDIFIDIDTPTVKSSLDGDSPFIEYKPGQKTYPFEMEVKDAALTEMQQAGINLDETSNFAVYTYGFPIPQGPIHMDKSGKWVDEVEMDENAPALSYNLIGYDAAGNQANWKEYYFVKEGTPVSYAKHNVELARSGDILSASLVLDNLQGVKEATWNFDDAQAVGIPYVNLVDAALTEKFKDKASIQVIGNKIKVTFKENTVFDRSEVVNIKVKVQDQLFYPIGYINPSANIVDANGQAVKLLNAGKRFQLKPRFNRVQGNIIPEGFLVQEEGQTPYLGSRDWKKVGATIKVTNGDFSLDATNLISRGKFSLEPLALSKDAYTFEVNVPGHFITKNSQKFGFEYKGVLYGKSETTNISLIGGDVNQDNVIDVQDALYVQTNWGTNNRNADINFDGTVDAKDFALIEKNYLKQNPSVQNAPTPKTIYNNQTLETIKSQLGL